MKKIILFLLIVVGVMAQNTRKPSLSLFNEREIMAKVTDDSSDAYRVMLVDSSGAVIDTLNVRITGITLNADSLFIKPPTGLSSGTKSVTTSASVIATTADAQEVWIINDNESEVIYFGGPGVTTSNGVPIYPKTSAVVRTDNISDVYVIASSTITARYLRVN